MIGRCLKGLTCEATNSYSAEKDKTYATYSGYGRPLDGTVHEGEHWQCLNSIPGISIADFLRLITSAE